MSESTPAIRVRDVRTVYDQAAGPLSGGPVPTLGEESVTALDGVSLTVGAGETVGLVGTNGAGKTTLFKHLVGHRAPDSGTVEVAGLSPEDGPAVRRRVGYLPEDSGFPPDRTGREVLSFHARLREVDDPDHRVERVLHTVGLAEAADRPVAGYSNGMTRRLGLATTLLGDPAVLLLDEPTAGLDPQGVEQFHRLVEQVATETDVAVLLTSHVLSEVERLADRVVVLDDGRVVGEGTVADLRAEAAETVTVTARPAGGETIEVDELLGLPTVGSVETGDDRVVVTCERGSAYAVLSTLRETADLAGFEVREPGLAEAFADLLDGEAGNSEAAVEHAEAAGESTAAPGGERR